MNKSKILSSIDMNYDITAEAHYVYCRDSRSNAKTFRDIIYAALELRICIEYLCFEYLDLFTYKKQGISKTELSLYKPEQLFAKALEKKPYFKKMVDFINVFYELVGSSKTMKYPDIKKLKKIYGRVGNYLHKQSRELSMLRKNQLITLIDNSLPILESYIRGRGSNSRMNRINQQILDDYFKGDINKGQMKRKLTIAFIPEHFLDPENRLD